MNLSLGGLVFLVALASGCSKPAPPAEPTFASLTGRWVRPDGGYILHVESVAPDGRAKVGYYNPRPIHVAAARAVLDGGTVKLFVELRDVGYPGCTYQLTYDRSPDRLWGVYFQAAQQQRYDVIFQRAP